MIQFFRNLIRNVFGVPPVAVDDAVAQLSQIEERLQATYDAQQELATNFRRLAIAAENERDRAIRVAYKINQLIA
jgi:ferritin